MIILLHGELVTFNFHFPQIRKVVMFMICGHCVNVHDPQRQLFLFFGSTSVKQLKKHRKLFQPTFGNLMS